jgi:hypothetical protein
MLQQAFCPVRQQSNIPPALNQCLMVPQVPQQQQQPIAPYQALLAAGGVARPPFVASRSAGKLSAEDYYQQMPLFLAWKGRKWRSRSESDVVLKGRNAWQSWSYKGLRGREDWRTKDGKGIGREMKKGKNELRRGKHSVT